MGTAINDVGTRIMNEHGVYQLRDTLTNDALLQTVCGNGRKAEQVDLYVDAKGLHLVWRPVKRDMNGYAVWNGGSLLMDTKSVDVTAEFAAKLDYDGEAPDFTITPKDEAKDDETWFITDPEVSDSYVFTIYGLRDAKGAHISHVFATGGGHSRLLLAADVEQQSASIDHSGIAMVLNGLSSDDATRLDTDADILSKARGLLK